MLHQRGPEPGVHRAAVHGVTTYVTVRGRRVAAVVPLQVADTAHRPDTQTSPS